MTMVSYDIQIYDLLLNVLKPVDVLILVIKEDDPALTKQSFLVCEGDQAPKDP